MCRAPNTKRSLCKKCNCLLLPSITSKIRYTSKFKYIIIIAKTNFQEEKDGIGLLFDVFSAVM